MPAWYVLRIHSTKSYFEHLQRFVVSHFQTNNWTQRKLCSHMRSTVKEPSLALDRFPPVGMNKIYCQMHSFVHGRVKGSIFPIREIVKDKQTQCCHTRSVICPNRHDFRARRGRRGCRGGRGCGEETGSTIRITDGKISGVANANTRNSRDMTILPMCEACYETFWSRAHLHMIYYVYKYTYIYVHIDIYVDIDI